MIHRNGLLAIGLAVAASVAATGASVSANHIRLEGSSVPAVETPAPSAVPMPTLQADEIRAGLVRAHTIYANRIEADEVRGAIVQSRGVKVSDSRGKLKAPEVAASVIYADRIDANTVVADTIYVRDLERR